MSNPTHKRCGAPEHEGNRYLTVDNFHKQGWRSGRQNYRSICKSCANRRYRQEYAETNGQASHNGNNWVHKKAYIRARSRALTRLSHLVPELYEQCLREELLKEGVGHLRTK